MLYPQNGGSNVGKTDGNTEEEIEAPDGGFVCRFYPYPSVDGLYPESTGAPIQYYRF